MDSRIYKSWIKSGMTVRAFAERNAQKYGMKESTVREKIRRYAKNDPTRYEEYRDLVRKRSSRLNEQIKKDAETFELWIKSGLTIANLAKVLGKERQTVRECLVRHAKRNNLMDTYYANVQKTKEEPVDVRMFADLDDMKAMALARKANQFIKGCVRGHDKKAV